MKHLIVGLSMIMMFVAVAVYFMFDMKKQHTKAFYTSEVRGYVIGKGLTDRATPYLTLHTPNGPTDVLVGSNAVYDKAELYDVVLKHANCDAVRVMKSGGEVLCANMLSALELQMVMTQQEIGTYCNCDSIAEPEPVELEEDSLEEIKTVAYAMYEVPLSRREYITELYMPVNAMVLPDSICSFTKIEQLSIWFSRLPQLDISRLACLDSLKVLNITNTDLKVIVGDAAALKHLITLDLSYNMIDSMPEFVCALTELEYLHLNTPDRTLVIPECIANLTKLRLLTLGTRNDDEPPVVYPEAEQERIRKLLPHARVMF